MTRTIVLTTLVAAAVLAIAAPSRSALPPAGARLNMPVAPPAARLEPPLWACLLLGKQFEASSYRPAAYTYEELWKGAAPVRCR
jgi:hypothetical protein